MAKYTSTLTTAAGTEVFLCNVVRKREYDKWQATFFCQGTFGGGTVNWLISFDGGTTKMPLYDASGAAITSTTTDNFTTTLGSGTTNSDCPKIYATLSGSAGATVTIGAFDNNN